jgi:phosphoadenosine phosphosulfate reductase
MVLIDMLTAINREARIFTLDTGRLNQETYDVMDEVRKRYGARVEVVFPDKAEVEEMVLERGVNLFYKGKENRILCCDIRKVRPLKRYLADMDGWITSIRRDQVETRAEARKFEIDEQNGGILKINRSGLDEQDMDYIKSARVYNKLNDMGYPSIGAPRTRRQARGRRGRQVVWKTIPIKNATHFNHNGIRNGSAAITTLLQLTLFFSVTKG